MSLEEQITAAWKEAMKSRDPSKDALALIRTELKSQAINARTGGEKGTSVADDTVVEVLAKMAKQRRESVAEYEKGGREDLAEKERLELAVIERYLPAQLSDAEIEGVVDDVLKETGASSMKELGKVMGPIMAKTKGRADGGRVQAIVKKKLGG